MPNPPHHYCEAVGNAMAFIPSYEYHEGARSDPIDGFPCSSAIADLVGEARRPQHRLQARSIGLHEYACCN